ncbi:MAG: hypothetical protein LBV53_02065 [Mycoplasmataceae bacterium]|jgi:hypothetical protein|nr:hypothetical protein [Mycoplasmataceae bacterium]
MRGKKKTIEEHKIDGTLRSYHKEKPKEKNESLLFMTDDLFNRFLGIKDKLDKMDMVKDIDTYSELIKLYFSTIKVYHSVSKDTIPEEKETDIFTELLK